jgi:predicted Zn-dependent peptidase
MIEFEDMSILSRANNLAFYELLGNANFINEELERYMAVTPEMLQGTAKAVLRDDNCSTLYYRKKAK